MQLFGEEHTPGDHGSQGQIDRTHGIPGEFDMVMASLALASAEHQLAGRNNSRRGIESTASGATLTPRVVLLLNLLTRQMGTPGSPAATHLDSPLSPEQALGLSQLLNAHTHIMSPRQSWLKVCVMCNIPRFHGVPVANLVSDPALGLYLRPSSQERDVFNEFHVAPEGDTPCCSKPICDSCYVRGIAASFQKDYCHNLASEYWIKCPFPSCESTLPLRHRAEVVSLLSSLYDPQLDEHSEQFDRARRLRGAMCALEPAPSREALVRGSRLVARLQKHGRMQNPLDSTKPFAIPVPSPEVIPVDSADGSETFQVPIFLSLLTTFWAGRECAICADAPHDVTDGTTEDESRWAAAIDGFSGDWTWWIRPFPVPASLPICAAKHALDSCRSCLGKHLDAQLESRGRAGSESLTCPSPGCGHLYTHEEIRMLASPETFARYDDLRLLNVLAADPEFRWCLREGCKNGQVHHFPDVPENPVVVWQQHYKIKCNACRFEMCFFHQVPWHEGKSCIGYDEQQEEERSRVARDEATEQWLRQNTKPCPGLCGASVEKKGGCFHMTCQVCRFEFCWECLADWTAIATVNPNTHVRSYRRAAHNPGCYFRRENAPDARMVMGDTVD